MSWDEVLRARTFQQGFVPTHVPSPVCGVHAVGLVYVRCDHMVIISSKCIVRICYVRCRSVLFGNTVVCCILLLFLRVERGQNTRQVKDSESSSTLNFFEFFPFVNRRAGTICRMPNMAICVCVF